MPLYNNSGPNVSGNLTAHTFPIAGTGNSLADSLLKRDGDSLLWNDEEVLVGAASTSQLENGAVTLAKLANIATGSVLGRTTAGTGTPEVLDIDTTLKTALGIVWGDVGSRPTPLTRLGGLGRFIPECPLTGLPTFLEWAIGPKCGNYTIQAHGDSTLADQSIAWLRLLAARIGTEYPDVRVERYDWDSANTRYGAPTVVHAAAGERGILIGTTGSGLIPKSAFTLPPDGETLIVEAKLAPASWAPAADQAIVSLADNTNFSGQTIFGFVLGGGANASKLRCYVYPNGTTSGAGLRTSTANVPFTGSEVGWVRVIITAASPNWTVDFYTSTDGVTWTQLGSPQTQAGSASWPVVTTQPLQVGNQSGSRMVGGTIYKLAIRGGSDNRHLLTFGLEDCQLTAGHDASWVGSPTVQVFNGAVSGSKLSDITARQVIPFRGGVTLVGHGHNHVEDIGGAFTDSTTSSNGSLALYNTLRTARPFSPLTVVIQNPQQAGASNPQAHIARQVDAIGWAKRNNHGVFNILDLWRDNNSPADWWADTVHPSATGYAAIEAHMWALTQLHSAAE